MTNNDIIKTVMSNHIITQKALSDAYNDLPIEINVMVETYRQKIVGQSEECINLHKVTLAEKLLEFVSK